MALKKDLRKKWGILKKNVKFLSNSYAKFLYQAKGLS